MGSYYCLMASLPEIELTDSLSGSEIDTLWDSLRESVREELTPGDRRLVEQYFFLEHDCLNLAALLEDPEATPSPDGVLTAEQYADLMTSAREMNYNVSRYPAFMSDFAREYPSRREERGFYPKDELTYLFLDYATRTCKNPMIREWHKLRLDMMNFLTAVLARRQGWDAGEYVKGDDEVTETIRQNPTGKDFGLGGQLDMTGELMKITEETDPVKKERMADALRWVWLEERTFYDPFSLEAVFAYLAKVEMLRRWAKLDAKTGEETFRHIIETLRGQAEVPKEFTAR